jgi:hypothetical protein
MRALKAATLFTVLMFIANCYVFNSIRIRGYTKTIELLHPTFGSTDSLVLGLFSAASMVSLPLMGIIGIIGIASSKRFGRSALIMGIVCCVLTVGSWEMWKKYGGIPAPGKEGPKPVYQQTQ